MNPDHGSTHIRLLHMLEAIASSDIPTLWEGIIHLLERESPE